MALTFLYVIVGRTFRLLFGRLRSDAHKDVQIAVLRHELGILRRQVKRPKYSPADRAVLATLGQLLPRRLWHDLLVRPETIMRWHRRLVAAKWTYLQRRPGRPVLDQHLVDLIVRLARENPRWGYHRIQGELRKLGFSVSATSIRTILIRNNLGPAPRKPSVTWRQFLKSQAAGIVACDFFTVETVRLKTLYVLFFIEIGSRRVRLAGVTAHPDGPWMVQQAREYSMAAELRAPRRFLIHDRDSKFSGPFDEVFAVDGVEVIRNPVRAPNANAYAERWVRTVREECLDWMLILGRRHLIQVLRVYIQHYNRRGDTEASAFVHRWILLRAGRLRKPILHRSVGEIGLEGCSMSRGRCSVRIEFLNPTRSRGDRLGTAGLVSPVGHRHLLHRPGIALAEPLH